MPQSSVMDADVLRKLRGKHLLLDTNIIIYQLNGTIDLSEEMAAAKSMHISAITQSELYAGTLSTELLELKDYLTAFNVVSVSSEIATLAGAYKSALPHLSLKDLLISATAELHKLTLVTANKRDFQGLTSISPVFIKI